MDPLNVGSKLDPQRLDLAENLSMKNNLAYWIWYCWEISYRLWYSRYVRLRLGMVFTKLLTIILWSFFKVGVPYLKGQTYPCQNYDRQMFMRFLWVPAQDPILKVGYLKLPHWCTSANVRLAWKIGHREALAYFVASKKFYYIKTSYLFSKTNNFTRDFCHNLTNSAPIFYILWIISLLFL